MAKVIFGKEVQNMCLEVSYINYSIPPTIRERSHDTVHKTIQHIYIYIKVATQLNLKVVFSRRGKKS